MDILDSKERLANAAAHIETLQMLLNKPAPEGATQRIYRTRGIIDDEYLVITILQNLSAIGGSEAKLRIFVDRSYKYTSFGAVPQVQIGLNGQYAIDELVAFLALDTIDPDSLTWTDETKYLLVVDSLRNLVMHG